MKVGLTKANAQLNLPALERERKSRQVKLGVRDKCGFHSMVATSPPEQVSLAQHFRVLDSTRETL